MVQRETISSAVPVLSIIIAVYNDWAHLDQCLSSLAHQTGGPSFEVIVVDDGSEFPIVDQLLHWERSYSLFVVRQPHSGIPSARNTGIRISKGSVLLFVDADSRLQPNCLAALHASILNSPERTSFQLRLIGDCSTLTGRAEELRLATLQSHLLQPNGCLRYLNTAGFAIRRAKVDIEKGLFDPAVTRAEDTLLLVQLLQSGEAPFFVAEAVVQHAVPPTLTESLRKRVRSAYLEARTYEMIAASGFKIRVSHRERLLMLRSMWEASKDQSIRRLAWFVLVFSQALKRIFSFGYAYLPPANLQVSINQAQLMKRSPLESPK
jgi:cellulose synthase/poly-beta-1,6-N-acetylglucosamine synthase-like glycosyltransferase